MSATKDTVETNAVKKALEVARASGNTVVLKALEQETLLVKERADNHWALPGGWADENQTPSQAILKEIREETGYEAKLIKLAAIHDNRIRNRCSVRSPHVYALFFIGEITGGQPTPNIEISEIDFFHIDKLPTLSEGKTSFEQIQLLLNHYQNINASVEFD